MEISAILEMLCCHDNGLCLRSKTWKIRVIMLVTLLVKFRNKDCKTTELRLLLQVLPVRIVTFVETLGNRLLANSQLFSSFLKIPPH